VVFLAPKVKKLHLVVRGEGLEASISQYLIERIGMLPNVELHTHTEVVALEGDEASGLTGATLRDRRTWGRENLPAPPFVSVHWRRSECPNGSRIAFKSTTAASW
jgi:thioredoxin reductase (NADPH)